MQQVEILAEVPEDEDEHGGMENENGTTRTEPAAVKDVSLNKSILQTDRQLEATHLPSIQREEADDVDDKDNSTRPVVNVESDQDITQLPDEKTTAGSKYPSLVQNENADSEVALDPVPPNTTTAIHLATTRADKVTATNTAGGGSDQLRQLLVNTPASGTAATAMVGGGAGGGGCGVRSTSPGLVVITGSSSSTPGGGNGGRESKSPSPVALTQEPQKSMADAQVHTMYNVHVYVTFMIM